MLSIFASPKGYKAPPKRCVYSQKSKLSDQEHASVYRCIQPALNYKKNMCCFHDDTFYTIEDNKSTVIDTLKEYLRQPKREDKDWLNCVGFNIPSEFEWKDYTFEQPVNFTRARFYGKTTFQNVIFEKNVTFSYSLFDNLAIFSSNIFKGEAHFSHVHFKQKVAFKGKPFEEEQRRNRFEGFTNFYHAQFDRQIDFSGIEFTSAYNGKEQGNFSHIDFADEVDFDSSPYQSDMFPVSPEIDLRKKSQVQR